MEESTSADTFRKVHFPRQLKLIKRLRIISFLINDITLIVSFLILLLWVSDLFGMRQLFFRQQVLYPLTPALFIFSCIALFFGARQHLLDTHHDAEKEERPWWNFGVPILFAAMTAILGFLNFIQVTNSGFLALFHISAVTGCCFFLIGLALIPPFTRIPHRFHITQSLIYAVSAINVFVILEHVYQLFSSFPMQHILDVTLPAAFSFVIFCTGLLFRWSNRGFFGNFTLDATASIFALRVFMINLLSAPLIAFFVLLFMQKTHSNMYIVLTLVVICITVFSSLLLWLNVKILYSHELEHLLMRESLRSHNIDLTKEQEKLQKQMELLERDKQHYLEKLNTRSAIQDAAERLG